MKTPGVRSLLALVISVLGIWIVYYLAVRPGGWASFGDQWKESGVFGDSFGALSCVFAGLAFAGVLFSLMRDHASAVEESERQYYKDLIDLTKENLATLEDERSDYDIEQAMVVKNELKFFILQYKKLLTSKSMPDDDIVKVFLLLGPYEKKGLEKTVDGLRQRLVSNGVISTEKLREMANDTSIIKFVHDDLYREHGRGCPDPDGYAVWGGMLYSLRNDDRRWNLVKAQFKQTLLNEKMAHFFGPDGNGGSADPGENPLQ